MLNPLLGSDEIFQKKLYAGLATAAIPPFSEDVFESMRLQCIQIGLPGSEVQSLLDELDRAAVCRELVKDSRRWKRYPYRTREVTIHVPAGLGKEAIFHAATRNISEAGLAFLYKQMLTVGTALNVDLPMTDGIAHMAARVRHCRYVSQMFHEVGVEFLHAVQPLTNSPGARA